MRSVTLSIVSTLALFATPVLAGEPNKDQESDKTQEPDKPVTNHEVGAKEVIETPTTDLNITKTHIPLVLVAAQQQPYTLSGLGTCQRLAAGIGELDAVLGDDLDLPRSNGKATSPGRVAQSVVNSFIPFSGVIREVSGANAHDREMQAAILAGVARRSFLKGVGQAKGCRYPARSATLSMINQKAATLNADVKHHPAREADAEAKTEQPSRGDTATVHYVSRPKVQQTD
jgi:hypothetical protein